MRENLAKKICVKAGVLLLNTFEYIIISIELLTRTSTQYVKSANREFMKRGATLKNNLILNDKGFLFNPETGNSFSFNQAGLFIIGLLRTGKTYSEIKRAAAKKYEIDADSFEKDLNDFVSQLKGFNLLSEN